MKQSGQPHQEGDLPAERDADATVEDGAAVTTRETIDAIRRFRRGRTLGDVTPRELIEDGRSR